MAEVPEGRVTEISLKMCEDKVAEIDADGMLMCVMQTTPPPSVSLRWPLTLMIGSARKAMGIFPHQSFSWTI